MRSVPELVLNPLGLQPCSSITSRGHQIVGLQIVLRDQKSKEGFKYQSVEIYWSEQRAGLLLCKTLVWETTQRAVLINKFQHFDIWSLPSIFDHAGRFEVQQDGVRGDHSY